MDEGGNPLVLSKKHPMYSVGSVLLSHPVLSSHCVKHVIFKTRTSHLIEILITTSNRLCPSEKERETEFCQKGKKKTIQSTFSSKDKWHFCRCERVGQKVLEAEWPNQVYLKKKNQMHSKIHLNWTNQVGIFQSNRHFTTTFCSTLENTHLICLTQTSEALF